jgi:hypothetical protein
MAFTPDEAYPPLIVDPNRLLPFSIALQRFQLISRGRSQYPKLCSCMQLE